MDTSGVMKLALDRAGFDRIPADSGIWVRGRNIKKVLFCVDAGAAEVILAKEMGYDLLIAHHPVGPARISFSKVVKRHVDFMIEKGVPRKTAERAAGELVNRIDVRAHPANYLHEVEVARMLRQPFMNIHLPIDQITRDYLLSAIVGAKARTVGELIAKLSLIEEFAKAKTRIEPRMGDEGSPLGKWVLLFAAGTNGGYPVAKAYFDNGIDTVIYLHIDYDELVKLKNDCSGNLVVLGHMAGDSIGINIFLKDLRSKGVRTETIGVVR
jgi:putative NIF3 family GTP cyclohydrolase 1 type 2